MRPRLKSSLLWGAIGVLAFLVLLQGYQLVTGYRYSVGVIAGITIAVAVGATVLAYVGDRMLFE